MKKILLFFHFESQLCPLTTVSPVNVELVCVTNSLQAGRSSWFPGLFLLRTFSFVVTVDGVDVIRKSPTVIDGKMLSTVLIWRPWGEKNDRSRYPRSKTLDCSVTTNEISSDKVCHSLFNTSFIITSWMKTCWSSWSNLHHFFFKFF